MQEPLHKCREQFFCVINNNGETVFHKKMECSRDNLELVTNTFGKDIVVGVECIFTWYWVADFCAERGIAFALGHAYYMKSIHGGKTKSDKIDSEKIANMLRGAKFTSPLKNLILFFQKTKIR